MSTHWGYHCMDCGANSPTWLNHGEATLTTFAQHAGIFLAVRNVLDQHQDLYRIISLSDGPSVYYDPTPLDFLELHMGHTISVYLSSDGVRYS